MLRRTSKRVLPKIRVNKQSPLILRCLSNSSNTEHKKLTLKPDLDADKIVRKANIHINIWIYMYEYMDMYIHICAQMYV